MILALACALCTAAAPGAGFAARPGEPTLLEGRLSLGDGAASTPSLIVKNVRALPVLPYGSGDGDHSDHIAPMWIMMGLVMAVMMVGMGVYLMSHASPEQRLVSGSSTPISAPLTAVPSIVRRGGGPG